MTSIGFRCWDGRFAFVVLDGTQAAPTLVASGLRKAPASASHAEALSWLRQEVLEICERHKPEVARFKATEPSSMKKDLDRAHFEGVLIEATQSSSIPCIGRIKVQLKKDLSFEGKQKDVIEDLHGEHFAEMRADTYADAAIVALAGLAKA